MKMKIKMKIKFEFFINGIFNLHRPLSRKPYL